MTQAEFFKAIMHERWGKTPPHFLSRPEYLSANALRSALYYGAATELVPELGNVCLSFPDGSLCYASLEGNSVG